MRGGGNPAAKPSRGRRCASGSRPAAAGLRASTRPRRPQDAEGTAGPDVAGDVAGARGVPPPRGRGEGAALGEPVALLRRRRRVDAASARGERPPKGATEARGRSSAGRPGDARAVRQRPTRPARRVGRGDDEAGRGAPGKGPARQPPLLRRPDARRGGKGDWRLRLDRRPSLGLRPGRALPTEVRLRCRGLSFDSSPDVTLGQKAHWSVVRVFPVTREETIFAAALGKGSGKERDAYLDTVCAGDADLRRGVEALLRAHEGAAGILE